MIDCLFCKIAEKTIPAKIVHEDPDVLAFEDITPQAPVHILVIPRKHMATLNEASDQDAAALGTLVLAARKIAKARGIDASGYRLVINTMGGAGQSVFHVHVHLLGGRPMGWPPG